MWRTTAFVAALVALAAGAPAGQQAERIEIPVRMVDGRLVVPIQMRSGVRLDFVLGLGATFLTRTGAERIGDVRDGLTLGGLPVRLGAAQVVADDLAVLDGGPAPTGIAGIVGAETFNAYDVLIDVPNGRLVLKPAGRSVRWEGVPLSNPVKVQVIHDTLIRTNVESGGKVFDALLDLAGPTMVVSRTAAASAGISDGAADFRLGYTAYPARRTRVLSLQIFDRWGDGGGKGFVLIGTEIARDCVLAVSYVHQEIRTCVR